jgi:hypothetical protein
MSGEYTFDEERLGQALATAFEHHAAPDAHRLKTIEDRLISSLSARERCTATPRWYWWLIVGLISTGAMAWWAGTTYFDRAEREAAETPALAPALPASPVKPAPAHEQKNQSVKGDTSRTIFQRERY